MTIDEFPEDAPGRPVWLMTLADLALLLVGFFVFIQASQQIDRAALARGIREGFGAPVDVSPVAMPVAAASLSDFASGSAVLPASPDAVVLWARDAARDGRVTLTITGSADGTPADVDPATGSAAVLAIDRARAVAAALARAQAIPSNRMIIASAPSGARDRRGVLITSGFSGERP